jgi:biopolymer transport protein ExbD
MGMNLQEPDALRSEINVTPLVDVVLVLLIIFMVIVPMTLRGYDMSIPGETVVEPTDDQVAEQIVLGIDVESCPVTEALNDGILPEDCKVYVNGELLAASGLPAHLQAVYEPRAKDDRVLFLAADDRLNYECVMQIVDSAKASVADLRIGLAS